MTPMERETARRAEVSRLRALRDAERALNPQPAEVIERWPSGEVRSVSYVDPTDD